MNLERINLLKKYIEEEPDIPSNIHALALEYREHDPNQAMALFKKIIARHADYLPSYYQYAQLLWDNGIIADAEQIFQQGIELAAKLNDHKALKELKSAYQNFKFENE